MSLPHLLTSLTEREAITDALYRAIEGFDNNDVPVLMSACSNPSSDITIEFNGNTIPFDALRAQLDVVGPMDTTHTISNVRVEYKDGADSASLTCVALAMHCPTGRGGEPDGPKYLVGSTYALDLVKDGSDGLWKIKKWIAKSIWRQGDRSIMQRPG